MVMIDKSDRIMVIIPHPDDETLGCAGILQRSKKMGLPVRVIYLTYGDANEWSFIKHNRWRLPTLRPSSVKKMGEVRYHEAISACKTLGVDESEIYFLGYPDFGTLHIWYKHWRNAKPAKGMLTRSTQVPYDTAYRKNAPYKGEEILADLKSHLLDFEPTMVFTSHRIDLNTDHQALYLFLRITLWDLKDQIQVRFFPFIAHYKGFPKPRGSHPKLKMEPPENLIDKINWRDYDLTPREITYKEKALNQHKTQMDATPEYLKSFVRTNEIFGDYKVILTSKHLENEVHQQGHLHTIKSIHPDDVTDEEYIGLEDHSIGIDEDNFIQDILLSRKHGRNAVITCYVFPYSFGKDFSQQPKYRIKITNKNIEFLNTDKKLESSILEVDRKPSEKRIILKVPLYLFKSPNYILVNVRSEINNITVDWVPWRIIRMIK